MKVQWSVAVSAVAAFAVVAPIIYVIWINQPRPPASGEITNAEAVQNYQETQFAALLASGIGQTDVTVHSFRRYESADEPPAPGHARYALELTFWNNTYQRYNLDPALQCLLCTKASGTFRPSSGGPEPVLRRRRMKPGDKARGYVTYELPEAAEPVFVIWGYRKFSLPAAEAGEH